MKSRLIMVGSLVVLVSLIFAEMALAQDVQLSFGGYIRNRFYVEGTSTEAPGADKVETTSFKSAVNAQFAPKATIATEGGWKFTLLATLNWTDGASATAEDTYIALNKDKMTFTTGFFQPMELFTLPNDSYVPTAGTVSTVKCAQVRSRQATNFALNYAASDTMTLEVGGVYGAGSSSNITDTTRRIGVRPAFKIKAGSMATVTGGVEYMLTTPVTSDVDGQDSVLGAGGKLELALLGKTLITLDGAYQVTGGKDTSDADLKEETTVSMAAVFSGPVGESATFAVGGGMDMWEKEDSDYEKDQMYVYGNYTLKPFLGYKGLRLENSVGYSTGTKESSSGDTDITKWGVFTRLRYDFSGKAS